MKSITICLFCFLFILCSVIWFGITQPTQLPGLTLHYQARQGGQIFYVSPTGDDTNPGTQDQPFQHIQHAADIMIAGDTTYVMEGTYQEMVMPKHSGQPNAWIQYISYPGDTVVIDAEAGARTAGIRINDQSYLSFDGFSITGADVAGVLIRGRSQDLHFNQLTITNNHYGMYFYGFQNKIMNCRVTNCSISDNTGHGIFVYRQVEHMLIADNHIYANGWGDDWGHNIKLVVWDEDDPTTGPHHISVIRNEVDHARIQGIMTWNAHHLLIQDNYCHHNGASGIQIEDGCSQVIVEGNICEYNGLVEEFETGIWVDDAEDVVVQHNIIRQNPIGFSATGSSQVIIRYNQIYRNDHSPVGSDLTVTGLRVDGAAVSGNQPGKDNIIIHNTLYQNGHWDSQRGGVSIGDYSHPPTSISQTVFQNNIVSETIGRDLWINFQSHLLDYNNYYDTMDLQVHWRGSDYSWEAYQTRSQQDIHSFTANPLFAQADEERFTLQQHSPCIDQGGFLTTCTQTGSGTTIPVADTRFFMDGYDLITADSISIGSYPSVRIVHVDHDQHTLTIDHPCSFTMGDPVSYHYKGSRPDMGAFEYELSPITGQLQGSVYAHATEEPLSGVTITVGGQTTSTGHTGTYMFSDIPIGTYTVQASSKGYQTSVASDIIIEENTTTLLDFSLSRNTQPCIPSKPQGPESGSLHTPYTYQTTSYDEDDDTICYQWDVDGDYHVDETTGYYPSGETALLTYSYDTKGSYQIRVRAEDEHGALSEWSDPLPVSIAKSRSPLDVIHRIIHRFLSV